MKLKLIDRIVIGNLTPKEGNFTTLIIVKDINKKVELTQDEVLKYDVKQLDTKTISWNKLGDEDEFEVEFTDAEKAIIKKELQKLDSENKLQEIHLNIYQLFVS